ncbi:hypothetical protein J4Q44_G00318010, partial [Coregonus suidteri]
NSRPQGPGSLLVSPISSPPRLRPRPPQTNHQLSLWTLLPSPSRPRPPPHPSSPTPTLHASRVPTRQRTLRHDASRTPPPNGHPPGPMIPPKYRPPPPGAYNPPSPHHWGPPPPSHYGPVPPSFGVSSGTPMARPMGPLRTYGHYGPRDHSIPPQHLPPWAAPYPPHGGPRDFPGQPPMQPQAPHGHDSSVGPQPGIGSQGQGQDYSSQQATAAPQDSVSSAMAEP